MSEQDKRSGRQKKQGLGICPKCGKQQAIRTERSFAEKLLCVITGGQYAFRKYYCKSCNETVYKSQEQCKKREGDVEEKNEEVLQPWRQTR